MTKKNVEFKIGEIVVYPKHGVGEIVKVENMEIASIKTKFYVVKMEQSKLTIRVPLEKQNDVGLRKISSKKVIEEVRLKFPLIGHYLEVMYRDTEDVLEEIVGEINDEFDKDDNIYSKLDDRTYVFEGKISLIDFLKIVKGENDYFDELK